MGSRSVRVLAACAALVGVVAITVAAARTAQSGQIDPEAVARAYLAQNGAVAGGEQAGSLDLLETRESPAAYHVRFQQGVNGVPVFGAYTTVNITKKTSDVSFALDRRSPVKLAATAGGQIDRGSAIDTAKKATDFQKPRGAATVSAVYFPVDGIDVLAWQVLLPALQPLGDWLVVVQADSADVLLKQNLLRFDSGQVFDPNPVVTSGGTVPPPSDCDSGANATSLSPQYRSRTLLGIQDGQNKLKGAYADLTAPGIFGAYKPSGQANEVTRSYAYACNDDRFEEVMVYHHVDATQRKIQSLGFTANSSILQRPIPAHAHYDNTCNAFYSQADRGLHFGDFDSLDLSVCGLTVPFADAAEDADVIVHEYGHAIQDDQVPGWGISNSALEVEQANAMGEGFGDFLAAAISGDPCESEWISFGLLSCNGQRGLRWLQNNKVYPASFEACPDKDDGSEEVHCAGDIWSGALWDLVEVLGDNQAARDLVLKLVLDSHFYLDPVSVFHEAAGAIMQADHDLYGGAHLSTIDAVFAARGIETGAVDDFPSVYFSIRHAWLGDLQVRLKIGSVSSPVCNLLILSPNPSDDSDDLSFAFDVSGTSCGAYLPPSTARPWYLEAQDVDALISGQIADFQVSLEDSTHRCAATDVPVAIPDNGPAVVSKVDCTTVIKAPGIPTATSTASATPTPTRTLTPTSSATAAPPTNTPTTQPSDTPTTQPSATFTPSPVVPTATFTPTFTPTAQPSDTPTFTPTLTRTPTRTPTPQGENGDANCNGSVGSTDAALILQLDAGVIDNIGCPQNADVNHDGRVDTRDAALVLQYDAGIIDELPG